MCLSTVYKIVDGETTQVFDSVKNFEVKDEFIVFTDILGDELSIEGAVERVDFVESSIYVTARQ